MIKHVMIYTDGACSGNPGPGGWGTVLKYGDYCREFSGGEAQTTNNRMEMTAVIMGLSALKERCHVTLVSDSKYVLDALRLGWAKKWQKNDWMRNKTDKALNPDLWEQLLELADRHEMEFQWIKGHTGHPQNEQCDKLAVAQADKYK